MILRLAISGAPGLECLLLLGAHQGSHMISWIPYSEFLSLAARRRCHLICIAAPITPAWPSVISSHAPRVGVVRTQIPRLRAWTYSGRLATAGPRVEFDFPPLLSSLLSSSMDFSLATHQAKWVCPVGRGRFSTQSFRFSCLPLSCNATNQLPNQHFFVFFRLDHRKHPLFSIIIYPVELLKSHSPSENRNNNGKSMITWHGHRRWCRTILGPALVSILRCRIASKAGGQEKDPIWVWPASKTMT